MTGLEDKAQYVYLYLKPKLYFCLCLHSEKPFRLRGTQAEAIAARLGSKSFIGSLQTYNFLEVPQRELVLRSAML